MKRARQVLLRMSRELMCGCFKCVITSACGCRVPGSRADELDPKLADLAGEKARQPL